jgi:tripartite-type tricarboxylate transporter receptor subunit TctC
MKPKLSTLILGLSAALLSASSLAQGLGSKTMRIVVPFSAGGPTDFIARQLAQPLSRELGMSVIVENRPGASGNIGTRYVVDAEPDGMTLVHTTAAMQAVNPLMYPDAPFHPSRDLVPVGITGALPNVLVVHPDSGIKTLDDLVKRGKGSNEALDFATFGPGSSPHFYGSLLRQATGISAIPVAYKGSAHAITDVLAGHVDFLFDSMTTSISHIQGGKLVGLAITSSQRSPLLPDVPTLKEAGYGDLDMTFWFALQAPAKTPADVVERLRHAIDKAVQDPEYRQGIAARGAENFYVKPAELEAFIKSDTQNWTQAAHTIGIKPE